MWHGKGNENSRKCVEWKWTLTVHDLILKSKPCSMSVHLFYMHFSCAISPSLSLFFSPCPYHNLILFRICTCTRIACANSFGVQFISSTSKNDNSILFWSTIEYRKFRYRGRAHIFQPYTIKLYIFLIQYMNSRSRGFYIKFIVLFRRALYCTELLFPAIHIYMRCMQWISKEGHLNSLHLIYPTLESEPMAK